MRELSSYLNADENDPIETKKITKREERIVLEKAPGHCAREGDWPPCQSVVPVTLTALSSWMLSL